MYDAHAHRDFTVSGESGPEGVVVNADVPDGGLPEASKVPHRVRRFYGLHPWRLCGLVASDLKAIIMKLENAAESGRLDGIGEVGLDGSKKAVGCSLERQIAALRPQIDVATRFNLPLSLHCVRAADPLLHLLREIPLPERGIHLHDAVMDGSMVKAFERLSVPVYRSFGERALAAMKRGRLPVWRCSPKERWLLETDATEAITAGEARSRLLSVAEVMAADLGLSLEEVCAITSHNWVAYFWSGCD